MPPEVLISPKNLTIIESNNVTFTCSAAANPSAVIQWIKAGKVISNSSNNDTNQYIIINKFEGDCDNTYHQSVWWSCSELSIINSKPGDSGDYACNATNDIASRVKYATLIVEKGIYINQLLTVHSRGLLTMEWLVHWIHNFIACHLSFTYIHRETKVQKIGLLTRKTYYFIICKFNPC